MKELFYKMARLFYEALAFLVKVADAICDAFAAVFKAIPQSREKPDIPRRDWMRPRSQKVRPLMLDRRSRVFHCRNTI